MYYGFKCTYIHYLLVLFLFVVAVYELNAFELNGVPAVQYTRPYLPHCTYSPLDIRQLCPRIISPLRTHNFVTPGK